MIGIYEALDNTVLVTVPQRMGEAETRRGSSNGDVGGFDESGGRGIGGRIGERCVSICAFKLEDLRSKHKWPQKPLVRVMNNNKK